MRREGLILVALLASVDLICVLSAAKGVRVIAGDGGKGFSDDADALKGSLIDPIQMVVLNGVVYFTDITNNRVRAINRSGALITVAGGGIDGVPLAFPHGLAIGHDRKSIIVASVSTNQIVQLNVTTGRVQVIAGTGNAQDIAAAPWLNTAFKGPRDVTVLPDGTIIVADTNNHKLKALYPSDISHTVAGTGATGDLDATDPMQATFHNPYGLTSSADGVVYIADYSNHKIRAFDFVAKRRGVWTVTGAGATLPGFVDSRLPQFALFQGPTDCVWGPEGVLLIADTNGDRIRAFDLITNEVFAIVGSGISTPENNDPTDPRLATISRPHGVAYDPPSGTIVVGNYMYHKVLRGFVDFAPTNLYLRTVTGYGWTPQLLDDPNPFKARLNEPLGLCIDSRTGAVIIADMQNHAIRTMFVNGTIRTIAGRGGPGYGDGPALDATFSRPIDVAIDRNGNVWIAEQINRRVRLLFTENATVTTVAGSGAIQDVDHQADPLQASFAQLRCIAVLNNDDVILCDEGANKIKRLRSGEGVQTFGGNGTAGWLDGPWRLDVMFSSPTAVVEGRDGTLYVADAGSFRIRAVRINGVVVTVAGSGVNAHADHASDALSASFGSIGGMALYTTFDADVIRGTHESLVFTVPGGSRVCVARIPLPTATSPLNSSVATIAGSGVRGDTDNPVAPRGQFYSPTGIAVSPIDGTIVVSDTPIHKLKIIGKVKLRPPATATRSRNPTPSGSAATPSVTISATAAPTKTVKLEPSKTPTIERQSSTPTAEAEHLSRTASPSWTEHVQPRPTQLPGTETPSGTSVAPASLTPAPQPRDSGTPRSVLMTILVSEGAAEGVVVSASVTTAVSGLASTVSPSQAVRIAALTRVLECPLTSTDDNPEQPSPAEHPIAPPLGSGRLRYIAGAVASTTFAFVVVPSGIHIALFLLLRRSHSKSAVTALKFIGRCCSVLHLYFIAPAMGGALTVILHPADSTGVAAAAACLLACTAVVALDCWVVASSDSRLSIVVEELRAGDAVQHQRRLENQPGHPLTVEAFSSFVEGARTLRTLPPRVFYCEELFVSCALALLAGIRPSAEWCDAVSGAQLAISLLHLAYLLVVKPYAAAVDMRFSLLFAVIQVASAALCIVAIFRAPHNEGALKALGVLLTVQLGLFFVQCIALFGVYWLDSHRTRAILALEDVRAVPLLTVGSTSEEGTTSSSTASGEQATHSTSTVSNEHRHTNPLLP